MVLEKLQSRLRLPLVSALRPWWHFEETQAAQAILRMILSAMEPRVCWQASGNMRVLLCPHGSNEGKSEEFLYTPVRAYMTALLCS